VPVGVAVSEPSGQQRELGTVLKWLRNNALGTHLLTRWRGKLVGEDEFGNHYYREPAAGPKTWKGERRWVVYAGDGEIEASSVPPGWNAWLHHNLEKPPSEVPLPVKRWEKEHTPNLTGTQLAYLPPGHELRGGQRDSATGDYEAWRP
jgi:NADH:ubiquinone oxidoreductase subunit